jgi:hypothetical protein
VTYPVLVQLAFSTLEQRGQRPFPDPLGAVRVKSCSSLDLRTTNGRILYLSRALHHGLAGPGLIMS